MKLKNKTKILSAFFITSCTITSVLPTTAQATGAPPAKMARMSEPEPRREVMTPDMLRNMITPIMFGHQGTARQEALNSLRRRVHNQYEYQICDPNRLATPDELINAYIQACMYRHATGDNALTTFVRNYIVGHRDHITQETAIELLITSAYDPEFTGYLIQNFNLNGDILNTRSIARPGVTPLEAAINSANPNTVEILLNAGARTDLPTSEGHTPYQQTITRLSSILDSAIAGIEEGQPETIPESYIQRYNEIVAVFHRHGVTR